MKQKTKKRVQGAISLMLVIILLPMMTLSALLVDTARYNLAKSMVSSAGDLAMSSALADYDTVLKDVYGLFAMTQSEDEWQSNVKQYFIDTVVNQGVVSEDDAENYVAGLLGDIKEYLVTDGNDPMNFMEMNVTKDQVTVSGVENSALSNPEILRKQIVEFMKYRGPLTVGASFLNALSAFTKVSDQEEVIEKQVEAEEQLTPINESAKKLYEWLKVFDKLYDEESQDYTDPNGTTTTYKFDTTIKSLNVYNDGTLVKTIQNYEEVLGALEGAFSIRYSYENINRIYLTFFKGAYATIYDVSDTAANKKNIVLSNVSGDYIKNNDGTYTVSVANLTSNSYSGTSEAALNDLYDELNSLKTLGDAYLNQNFFPGDYTNSEKTGFNDEYAAEEAFLSYTKFLKGKLNQVKYTDNSKNNIKTIIEDIDKYAKAIKAYNTEMDKEIKGYEDKIKECKSQINQLNSENTSLNSNVKSWATLKGEKESEYQQLQGKINSDAEQKEQYDTVKHLLENIKTYNVSKEKATNKEDKDRYQDDIDNANWQIDEIKNEYENIKTLYDVEADMEDYQTKIDNANSQISTNKTTIGDKEGTKSAYESQKTTAESKKKEQNANYQAILKQYYNFSKAYQEDINRYWNYVDAARNLLNTETTWVSNVVTNIIANLKKEQAVLKSAKEEAQNLLNKIDEYTNKVNEWKKATEAYGDADTGDSFYESNMSEAEQDLKTYDKEQIKLLKEGIEDRYDNITNLIKYIEADGHYCYGVNSKKKIKDIKSVTDLRSATSSSEDVELADSDTINSFFSKNYMGENPSGDNSIDNNTFGRFESSQYKFYFYLQSTFPESLSSAQQELVSSDEQSDGGSKESVKSEYKNVKEQANKNGSKQTDDNGSSYNYTYKSRSSDALTDDSLPSKGSTGAGSSDTNKGVSISTDDDSNISGSVKEQTSVLNSVLGGIKEALTAGRDNLYILAYIFENFSYNTIVQDLGVADGVEVTLSTNASAFNDYLGKANTLTNVSINEKNNYMYGAEIEYILYGNKSPSTNVTLAKGSIFATRFAFNSIYAFTNKEIKTSTAAAGMAVQAATFGVVPYKVVQIVMQIALSLAESAIDLQQMSMGAKIAVVKSTDTWMLGSGGLKKAAVDLAKEETKELVKAGIEKATEAVSNKLNELTDATADNIEDVAEGVINDVTTATNQKVDEIISGVFDTVENNLYQMLETLVYAELETQAALNTQISAVFATVKTEVDNTIDGYTDTVGTAIAGVLKSAVNDLLDEVKNEMLSQASSWGSGTFTQKIVAYITDLKITMASKIQNKINDIQSTAQNKVNGLISEYKDKIHGYLAEGTEKAKEKILDETNNYIDKTFNSISDKIDSGLSIAETGVTSSTATSKTLKLGYKDYLMIFTYIAICTNGDNILKRTGDVIQLNIANASSDSDLNHKAGTGFKLNKAYTYVSLGATVDLQMLFLKMDLFSNQIDLFNEQLTEENPDFEEMDVNSISSFSYQGVMGY